MKSKTSFFTIIKTMKDKITYSNILKCGFILTPNNINVLKLKDKFRAIDEKQIFKLTIESQLEDFDFAVEQDIYCFKAKNGDGILKWFIIKNWSKPREVKFVQDILELDDNISYNKNQGFVYFIQSEFGIKIGQTKHLNIRMNVFNVKLPFKTTLLCFVLDENYKNIETMLHNFFKNRRINGEWFDINENNIMEVTKNLRLPTTNIHHFQVANSCQS